MWDTAKISLQAEVRISAGVNFRKWSDFFPFFLVAVVSGGGGATLNQYISDSCMNCILYASLETHIKQNKKL